MSIALIQESAKEVRRLAIAGSPLAVGDFRLKKLIAPLEQAGAKVPVFAQVGKAISELVNGTEAESAARLLSLSTLLNAILYTQGQTGAEGDYREIEIFATNCSSTRTTARVLKPLVEALTTTGGGRSEIVKAAVERGVFNDLRLIDPAIRALDDNYPELADLVAEKILPAYGSGIAPLLKQKLDVKGKKSDARRLRILHQLDPAGTIELCKNALDEGSPEVKVSAIGCLGKHEECIPLVLEQTRSKHKAVRETALEALAVHDRPEVTKLFTEMIQGETFGLVAGALRLVKSREVFNSLLSEARSALEKTLKNDGPSIPRLFQFLQCLEERKDSTTEEFLLACIAHSDQLIKVKFVKHCVIAGVDIIRELAELLCGIGSQQCLNAVMVHQDKVPFDSFHLVVHSGLLTWPPGKFFDQFSPLFGQKKGPGKDQAEVIERAIRAATERELIECVGEEIPDTGRKLLEIQWDARWLDAAIKTGRQNIVCYLAKPGHKGAVTYLLKVINAKNQSQTALIIRALARCRYPKLTDVFLDVAAKKTKGAPYFDHDMQLLFQSARHLPASDLARLDAFAAKLDEKFVDKFLEALEPLRPAKQLEKP